MCGIAAILNVQRSGQGDTKGGSPIDPDWLRVLDDAIAYRGPDGSGRFSDQATTAAGDVVTIAMVHRRLSILDHEMGAQPMARDGITVCFNGCIYNHRELRNQLTQLGSVFISDHSDTEVLVHGWKAWGHDLWAKLDGMFAVILWDADKVELVVARDQFGEKPLYVAHAQNCVIIASTPGAIERVARHSTFPSPLQQAPAPWAQVGAAVAIAQGAVQREFQWRGIKALPPGQTWSSEDLRSSQQQSEIIKLHRSWGNVFGHRARSDSTDAASVLEQVEGAIERGVVSRLEADVPIAGLLSGGVDSSLVCALARKHRGRFTTICVRMPHAAYDESVFAAQAAAHLHTDHHTIEVAPRPAEDLERLIGLLGQPFGDSSLLPAYWACRAAAQHAKVLLSGDGGDELFMGYERYQAIAWLHALGPLASLLGLLPTRLFDERDPKSRASKRARFVRAAAGEGYLDLTAIFPSQQRRKLIGGAIGRWATTERCIGREYQWDITDHFPDVLLTKVDHASLAAGIELRAPLLAGEVSALALSLSDRQRTPGGERKGLLRAISRKYLPSEIIDRPKMGFAIPIGEWFRSDYGGLGSMLTDALASADPFPATVVGCEINLAFARALHAQHMEGVRDHSQRLYMLLVLAIWCRQQGVGAVPRYALRGSD